MKGPLELEDAKTLEELGVQVRIIWRYQRHPLYRKHEKDVTSPPTGHECKLGLLQDSHTYLHVLFHGDTDLDVAERRCGRHVPAH